jgi:hypothetical protein
MVTEVYKNNELRKTYIIPRLVNKKPKAYLYHIRSLQNYTYEDILHLLVQSRLVYIDAFGIERFTDKAITAWL